MKLRLKLLTLLLICIPYIGFAGHITETNDITFSGSATLLNITISNEVINSAETDTDNIGMQSVTFPISNSQTGSVWMGYATLYDAPGAYNSALGNASLYHSTGSYNSAVGNVTLQSSPGSFNSALGYSALLQSPGDGNSAIGYTALRQAPGSYNLAGGYGAGYKSGGVSNVFLGANAAVNGTLTYYTNAIAIGAGAVPLGNNSMVLGNAQTTNTEIKGKVVVSNTVEANLFIGNGSGVTNNYWSWWMLDPAPITTSVNGTNVYPIGLYDYDVAITNRSGGATSGTGVYDIVKWNPSNSVDFVGTLVYTGLVSTLGGVNAGLDVTLPKGSLYGIRLTNQTGLAGWHIQLRGVTK